MNWKYFYFIDLFLNVNWFLIQQQKGENNESTEKEIQKLKELLRAKDGEIEELMSMQVEMLNAVKDLKDKVNDYIIILFYNNCYNLQSK